MAGEFDDLVPATTPASAGVFDDLVPTETKAAADPFDDLVPAGRERKPPVLEQGHAKGLGTRIREGLSPLLGPTKEQVLSEGILDAKGNIVYKPAGGAAESEGFFPALSHPFVPIPKATGDKEDGKLMAATKAVYNTAAGFGEFMESPLGVATWGIGSLAAIPAKAVPITADAIDAARLSRNLGKAVAGGYAVDMGMKVPEAAANAGTLSVTGNTQQKIEADLGLGVNVVLPGLLGGGLAPEGKTPAPKPAASRPAMPPGEVSEFGGEAAVPPPAGAFDDLIPATPAPATVQTSAPVAEAAPAGTTVLADAGKYPTVEVPLKNLKLSEDVPNFKADADADTGVVAGQSLDGKYERLGTGAITVYERANGDQEVISGRHRFDLAKRTGEKTIPAQIVREADGFTPQMAMTLDAEMNIRDGQGTVGDYANYFRNSDISEADAQGRGLLSRAKGQAGWTLGNDAGDDLYALYRAGKVNEGQAVAIASAAPGEEALQRVGSKAALNGAGPQELANFIQAVRFKTRNVPADQLDLFGSNDAAMNEAQRLAKVATTLQRELDKEIRATDNAARNAEGAKAKGIEFTRDPQEILKDNAKLRVLRNEWNNWALHPELVDRVLQESGEAPTAKEPTPGPPAEITQASAAAPVPRTLEDKLASLKVNTNGMLLEGVTSLPIHVWNAAMDVAILAVKGGKTLAQGIQASIDWLKAQHPDMPFDEQQYRDAVNEKYGLREFGQKLQADPEVSPAVKSQVSEYVYQKRTNESDADTAQRLVQEHGMPGAIALYKDEGVAIPGAVRSVLGKLLIRALGDAERVARSKGDTAGADRLVTQQVDVVDHDLKRSTDVAQALQAMRTYGDMTPEGILGHARRLISEAGDRIMTTIRPATEMLRRGFSLANDQALNETIHDQGVNGAARAAVNEAIADSADTRRAVVVEVAHEFAQSPEIMRQARAAFRGQAERLGPEAPGVAEKSKIELAQIFDDLAKRVAGIAASHYQGAELGKTLAEKIAERTGLDAEASKRLAKALDAEFGKMVTAARNKIPQRIAAMRARQAAPFDPDEFSQFGIDAEIRRQLREQNLKLGELVKQHGATVDATGRTIGQRVVADAGLTGPRADALQAAFDKRFAELAAAKKQKLVEQMLKDKVRIPPKLRSAIGDLVKLTNVGAFDDATFYDALRKKLELPTVTPEMAKEIVRRANELQALPEGFQRDRASNQLLNFIGQQKQLKLWELPMSMWYANVLSGFTTPVHIMLDNMGQLAGNTLVSLVRQPGALRQAVPALGRGLVKGGLQSAEILKSGIVTGVNSAVHTSHLLELDPFKGPAGVLNYWKYVGRTLSATHVLMFKPAMELKQTLIARGVARSEGLSGAELRQRVADIMGNTEARVDAARAQAVAEGLSGLDLRRRMGEVLEQSREASAPGITAGGRDYALRSTYLNDPYGVLGSVVKGLNTTIEGIGREHSKLGFVPKMLVPFTRIVGNIVNEKMNWTPVGAYRAMRAWKNGELYGKPIEDPTAVGDLMTKSILGTAAVTALAAAAAPYLHDDDPKFAITGNGPASVAARKQLQAAGWRPHSIKVGDHYIDYLRTPLAIPMAVVGNYMDALRYRHFDEADAVNRLTFVLKGTADTIVHQSFLDSVAKLFEAVGNENTKSGGQQLATTLTRSVSSFVVPNLLMQIDRAFDPTRYNDTDITSMVRAQIPFVRRMNKPALNVLGEPVEAGVFDRDYGQAKPDPLWRVLTEKQAWVPEAGKNTIIGDKSRGPDHYRAMTQEEYYDYVAESGTRIRNRLESKIDRLQNMEPEQARKLVQQITTEQRAKVLKSFSP